MRIINTSKTLLDKNSAKRKLDVSEHFAMRVRSVERCMNVVVWIFSASVCVNEFVTVSSISLFFGLQAKKRESALTLGTWFNYLTRPNHVDGQNRAIVNQVEVDARLLHDNRVMLTSSERAMASLLAEAGEW